MAIKQLLTLARRAHKPSSFSTLLSAFEPIRHSSTSPTVADPISPSFPNVTSFSKAVKSKLNPDLRFAQYASPHPVHVDHIKTLSAPQLRSRIFGMGHELQSVRTLLHGRLVPLCNGSPGASMFKACMVGPNLTTRYMTTAQSTDSVSPDGSGFSGDVAPRIKFKRLDKTAGHIMRILDKEAVEGVRAQREIPDIKPGYVIQLKVEVPENKRRVSTQKGIVIARRNAGLNTTFRLRRLVAGVGVESVFLLYSPNIKEIKVLEKKKVRRAKLYYLRDRMNALKKQ